MLRQAVSRSIGEEKTERVQLEKGRHMCRKVTAALQKQMFGSLSSGGGSDDFASACAPVIVYSQMTFWMPICASSLHLSALTTAAMLLFAFCVTFCIRYGAAGSGLWVWLACLSYARLRYLILCSLARLCVCRFCNAF